MEMLRFTEQLIDRLAGFWRSRTSISISMSDRFGPLVVRTTRSSEIQPLIHTAA